jgi:hypothetical protein
MDADAAVGVESAAAAVGEDGGGDGAGDDCELNRWHWRTNRLTDVVVVNREATVVATSHYSRKTSVQNKNE